jgi:ammonia channel protein AmtB
LQHAVVNIGLALAGKDLAPTSQASMTSFWFMMAVFAAFGGAILYGSFADRLKRGRYKVRVRHV